MYATLDCDLIWEFSVMLAAFCWNCWYIINCMQFIIYNICLPIFLYLTMIKFGSSNSTEFDSKKVISPLFAFFSWMLRLFPSWHCINLRDGYAALGVFTMSFGEINLIIPLSNDLRQCFLYKLQPNIFPYWNESTNIDFSLLILKLNN